MWKKKKTSLLLTWFQEELPENVERAPCLDLWWMPSWRLSCVKICFSTTVFHVTTYKRLIHLQERSVERKRERMAAFSFSGCVVAVAKLDGCVCQRGRPCSLMMAMPSHKPSPADVYVWFFRMDEVCVWLWQLINLPQRGSPVRRRTLTDTITCTCTFELLKNNEKHATMHYHSIIK